jgi:hypothetical protein
MSNPTPQNNQPSTDSTLPILALVLAFVFPLAGAIIGMIALKQIREGRLVDTNKGLAKAGVIVGWVFTGLLAAYVVLTVVVAVYLTTTGIDYFP